MSKKPILLSPPHLGHMEMRYIEDAVASNWIAPAGPHIAAFEQAVAAYVGSKGAVALNSGTAALHVALRLADVQPGDYVLCSSLTFIATANPIVYLGGIPVFIDSEENSWNLSPTALETAILELEQAGKKPKAVVVVHLYGQCANMLAIMDICERHGIVIVEDAAEALGTRCVDRYCGTFGKYGIYSFNGNKLITTSGGGMLVSDDEEALDKARYWASQAREPLPYYQHKELGYNYRLSNLLAGIGLGQMSVIEERITARRNIHQRYYDALNGIDGIEFIAEPAYGYATHWLTAIQLDPHKTAIEPLMIIKALAEDNIEARCVWKPLHMQPIYNDHFFFAHNREDIVSERLFKRGICLPSGSSLTIEDQERVIHVIETQLQRVMV